MLADFLTGNFLWRLSSAKISQNCDFSLFPNHDRLLSVLQGGDLQLNLADELISEVLIKPFSVFQFNGAKNVKCELRGSEIVDLGLIYNPKRIKASLSFETLAENPLLLKLSAGLSFIICAASTSLVADTKLEFLDAIKFEVPQDVWLQGPEATSRVAIVNIQSLPYGLN